ncbi:protein shc1 [Lasius niger]|uniref:Protein shc1 n=1 Tax=Lasius niger TaxID=67767 RepID=A0A0J7KYI7_LASNI|nr:protein shc1 [Lasius niger]
MWKVVFRGIRETLERRVCRTNVYSQSSQDNAKNEVKTSLTCQQKFLPPIFISCDRSFYGSARSAGAKDKKHEWNTKHSWPEAVGWSSVLAAGWVVCQTLCFRKRIFGRDNETLKITNCIGNNNKKSNNKLQDSDSQWTAAKPFGPITIEEALKEAADEFANTHKIVIGEYEFRYGIKALKEKRYEDALMHFSSGANLSSPGSMFNLGLCYELGIGTLADQKKAVKYYNDAAAHDHADALYNLGVFHAQGRGGLPIDIDVARTYFVRAAKLGQVQAQHALDLEKAETLKKNNNAPIISNRCLINEENLEKKANDKRMKLNDYTLNTDVDKILNTNFIAKCTLDAPKYEGIVENPTQVFLDLLGLRESSQAPIMITNNDCHVSC